MLTNMSLIRSNMAQRERRCRERPTSTLSSYHCASRPRCSPHYFPRVFLYLSISHFPKGWHMGFYSLYQHTFWRHLLLFLRLCQAFDEPGALGHGLLITELHTHNLCRGGSSFSLRRTFHLSRDRKPELCVCSHWLCSVDKAASWHPPSLWHLLDLLALRHKHGQRLVLARSQSLEASRPLLSLCHHYTLSSHPLLTN